LKSFDLGLHFINQIAMEINTLKQTASQIRRDIVRMVHGVQSGHPGGSLGCTDFLTAL
jgi:transketolase